MSRLNDLETMLITVAKALGNEASTQLKTYISEQINALLNHSDFAYVIQTTANNNTDREAIIFERLEALVA